MERAGMLKIWCDREIDPGVKWEDAILRNMDTADMILLMVSAAYYDSSYIHEKELKYALMRHNRGEATVIPVIVRPCDFDADPIASSIQSLPKDAKPVTEWPNRDNAWLNVVKGIRKEVEKLDNKRRSIDINETSNQDFDPNVLEKGNIVSDSSNIKIAIIQDFDISLDISNCKSLATEPGSQ
jgi:hypothetical protein